MGPRPSLNPNPNQTVADLDRVGARRLVSDEAGARGEIERPGVVGAREVAAEHVAFDEGVALMRARVGDGVNVALDAEDGDLVTLVLDERAAVRLERRERNREPVRHS